MAPAEVWQGGSKVNKVEGDKTHVGKRDGVRVVVVNDPPGCQLVPEEDFERGIRIGRYLKNGESETLDGGEIIKSVRR